MKKYLKITNIDCPVCANKIEDAVRKIAGINNCTLSFLSERMVIDINEDNADLIQKIIKVCHKIEPECQIIER